MERWKPIPGFEPYEASTAGNIRRGNHVLRPYGNGNGYRKVRICGRRVFVHRLVALAHQGTIPKGFHVDHIDNDRTNDVADNLQIITPSENIRKAYRPTWYRTQLKIENMI